MSSTAKPVLNRIPFFPFLLALSPVLNLFAVNSWGLNTVDLIRPALVHLVFTFFIFVIFWKILGSYRKAAVPTFILIFGVISFGLGSQLTYSTFGSDIPELYILSTWSVATLGMCFLLTRVLHKSKSQLFELTAILNTFGVVLVFLSLLHLFLIRPANDINSNRNNGGEQLAEPTGHEWLTPENSVEQAKDLPDFYFIITDAYARDDILKSRFGFDNAEFIEWLRSKGFFVSSSSHSNYAFTHLSLASTLNAEYLQSLVPGKVKIKGNLPEDSLDRFQLIQNLLWYRFIRNSRVVLLFASLGYRIDSNRWLYKTVEGGPRPITDTLFGPLSETEKILLKNSILRPVFSKMKKGVLEYDEVTGTLYSLVSDAKGNSPKFVFYHIMSPHEPFCFDSYGNPVPSHPYFDSTDWITKYSMDGYKDYFRKNYPKNIEGLNRHLKAAIQDILDVSLGNAIIIIQSDHGSALGLDPQSRENTDMMERFGILNAVYLPPDFPRTGLTDDISSVNTFPAVLNNVFNLKIPLQENRAYFSFGDLDFADVTDQVRE